MIGLHERLENARHCGQLFSILLNTPSVMWQVPFVSHLQVMK